MAERPKREAIYNLTQLVDKPIHVQFSGGKRVTGVLKGHDQLFNLVLDEATETLIDAAGMPLEPAQTRHLGLAVLRGPLITVISPVDGFQEIENPFLEQE